MSAQSRAALGRERKSLQRQDHVVSTALDVSDNAIADRERRLRLAPASLTAAIFGDPLPGYSALDRKSEGCS